MATNPNRELKAQLRPSGPSLRKMNRAKLRRQRRLVKDRTTREIERRQKFQDSHPNAQTAAWVFKHIFRRDAG